MAPPIIPQAVWPGSGSSVTGSGATAYGFFTADPQFIVQAPQIADWVCSSLGYPIMSVELLDTMIYRQIEIAILDYSAQVNEFNMRDNMLTLQGLPLSDDANISQTLIRGTPLPFIVEMAASYGTEAQSGGDVNIKRTCITLIEDQQDYDLTQMIAAVSESGNRIEVTRIFNDVVPAIERIFDPFSQAGFGVTNLMADFGWGAFAVPTQFLLTPIFETLLRVQQIEFNDIIRRSNYGFELHNNVLRVFPVPDDSLAGSNIWIEYRVIKDKYAAMLDSGSMSGSANSVISDYSNAPYGVIMYSDINSVGQQWIRNYTLALCKIVLGNVRAKYEQIPIPNAPITLDGLTLRQEGDREREILIQQLRETLQQTGMQAQMEKQTENQENMQTILKMVPNLVYIF